MKLFLRHFPPYVNKEFVLPDTGIVVFQGNNGSGKSTVLEAYCTALFAKSLRGASPWREKTDLRVEIGGIAVERTEKKLAINETEALKPTKKKPELASLVGSWDVFTRTRVFDADLTARFGASTDSEKKQLLERLLGLEHIAEKLKAVRVDLRTKSKTLGAAQQKIEVARAGLRERPEVQPPDPTEITTAKQRVAELSALIKGLAKEEGTQAERKRELESRVTKLNSGVCPLCASPVKTETVARLREELEGAKIAIQTAEAERKHSSAQGQQVLAQLQVLQAAQLAATESAKVAARRAELTRELEAAIAAETTETRELQALKDIEGFFAAARPRMLEELLAGIHRIAATWLSTLTDWPFHLWLEGDDLRLKLGDRQYKELSRGQRRRVDLAILLACSQLQGGGTLKHPLFLDEFGEGMDDQGYEGVVAILEQVAETDLVIVMTHSKELAGKLRGEHYFLTVGPSGSVIV